MGSLDEEMQKNFAPSEATDGRDASDGDARVRFELRLMVSGRATEPVLSMVETGGD